MKTIKTLLITAVVLLYSTAATAHDFYVDGIYYNITDATAKTVEVTYAGSFYTTYDNEYRGAVVIPETVTYNSKTYSVTTIGKDAFCSCSGLTSVTIPNSVTTIGSCAFEYCIGLTAVRIGDIAAWCRIDFGYYSSNPLYHAENLYLNGEKVTNLVIPNGVTEIKNYALCGCSSLTSVTIPNSVTTIGKDAFYGCTGLTSITIPNSVTTIVEYAFYDCTGLTSITIPNSVTTIGYKAFKGCDIAKTIWLTNTPPSGYSYAQGKINYVANNQYTSLGNVVVYPYLSSLFEIDGIKYVPVSPAERTCDAIDCIYDTAIETINIGKTVLYKNIAMNVKEVMPYTCYKNKNIRNLTISNDGSVGDKAFYGCTGLNEITISNKGDIGASAFESSATSGPAKLEISNDGSVGDKAFYGCTGLNDIAINNKGDIGASAFEGSATSGPAKLEISNDSSIGDKAFYACTGLSDITIGNKGDIGTSAFEECTGAFEITLGDGIASIGRRAFYACSSLKEIIIPNSVTSLNSYVFYNCSALNSVVLSDGIKTIAEYAFSGCSALPEIKIPQAVVEIGNYAFAGCSSLADVIIENRTAALSLGPNGSSPLFADCPLDSVYVGGKISYKTSPFYRNSSLRSVVITDVEEQIYDNEFYGCTGLKNVQIGNGVKSIGKWAFSGCSNLDYLIVGANVSSIGQEAFSDCSNVTTIYAHAMVPPVCEAQALEDINKWNCTLMVPNESIADYQAAEQWKDFFFISNIPTGITEISPDDIEGFDGGAIYDLYGRPVSEPAKGGVYIIDGKKVVL